MNDNLYKIDDRTALAESELEYKADHTSNSIYLKLELCNPLPEVLSNVNVDAPVHIVIWTTTPWSIPANQSVCYNANKDYSLVKKETENGNCYLIVASELITTLEKLWSTQLELLSQFPGARLWTFRFISFGNFFLFLWPNRKGSKWLQLFSSY